MPTWIQRPQRPPFDVPAAGEDEQRLLLVTETVSFETVDLMTVGAVIGPVIKSGAIVLDAFGQLVTEFTTDTNQSLILGVAPVDDPEAFINVVTLTGVDSAPPTSGALSNVLPRSTGDPIQVLCGEDARLIAYLATDTPGSIVAGEVAISFMVAD